MSARPLQSLGASPARERLRLLVKETGSGPLTSAEAGAFDEPRCRESLPRSLPKEQSSASLRRSARVVGSTRAGSLLGPAGARLAGRSSIPRKVDGSSCQSARPIGARPRDHRLAQYRAATRATFASRRAISRQRRPIHAGPAAVHGHSTTRLATQERCLLEHASPAVMTTTTSRIDVDFPRGKRVDATLGARIYGKANCAESYSGSCSRRAFQKNTSTPRALRPTAVASRRPWLTRQSSTW